MVDVGEDSFFIPVADSGKRASGGRNRRTTANDVDVDADRVRLWTVAERSWIVGAALNSEIEGKKLVSNDVGTRLKVAWDSNRPDVVVLDQAIVS